MREGVLHRVGVQHDPRCVVPRSRLQRNDDFVLPGSRRSRVLSLGQGRLYGYRPGGRSRSRLGRKGSKLTVYPFITVRRTGNSPSVVVTDSLPSFRARRESAACRLRPMRFIHVVRASTERVSSLESLYGLFVEIAFEDYLPIPAVQLIGGFVYIHVSGQRVR